MSSSALVEKLLASYNVLTASCDRFRHIVTHTDNNLPFILPDYCGPLATSSDKQAARSIAVNAITQLWHLDEGEYLPSAGLLCVNAEALIEVEALNNAKSKFKQAILALRDTNKSNKSSVDKLIAQIIIAAPKRDELLIKALKRAQLSRLDLLRCYANIRVMPTNLRSISWTWARTHSTSKTLNVAHARKLGEALETEALRSMVADLLSGYKEDDLLAYKKKLPNRLQANLVWKEDEQVRRKAVTISGIVLSPEKSLPKYIWRNNPDKEEPPLPSNRIRRIDAKIMPEPFIKALKLHEIE